MKASPSGAHLRSSVVFHAQKPRRLVVREQVEAVAGDLRAVAAERRQFRGGEVAGIQHQRRRAGKQPERIHFVNPEHALRWRRIRVCRGDRGRQHATHAATGHRDIEQRRRLLPHRGHHRRRAFVHDDVVGVPVEAVVVEGHDHVRFQPGDGGADVRVQRLALDPRQEPVAVVQQDDLVHTQHARRVVQLAGAGLSHLEAPRIVDLAQAAAARTEQRHPGATRGAPRQEAAGGERFVVGMREDGQQRTTGVGTVVRNHARAPWRSATLAVDRQVGVDHADDAESFHRAGAHGGAIDAPAPSAVRPPAGRASRRIRPVTSSTSSDTAPRRRAAIGVPHAAASARTRPNDSPDCTG